MSFFLCIKRCPYILTYMNHTLLCILTAPGLAWQAALKKTTVKLDFLTDIDVLNGRKRY